MTSIESSTNKHVIRDLAMTYMMPKPLRTSFLSQFQTRVVLTLSFLLLLLLLNFFIPSWNDIWQGALSATLAPLFVMMLRMVLQMMVRHRKGGIVWIEMVLLGIAFGYIFLQTDLTTYWHWALSIFFLLASFWGVFQFRLSSFFMIILCAVAGSLLF